MDLMFALGGGPNTINLYFKWHNPRIVPFKRPLGGIIIRSFVDVLEIDYINDLLDVYEGNIARYKLRPSEYEAWKSLK
jgi:hypothetical protein